MFQSSLRALANKILQVKLLLIILKLMRQFRLKFLLPMELCTKLYKNVMGEILLKNISYYNYSYFFLFFSTLFLDLKLVGFILGISLIINN